MTSTKKLPVIDYDAAGQTTLFHGLERDEIEMVCQEGAVRKILKGEFFFIQGDPAEYLFLLIQGRVKLTQSDPDGQQVLMRAIGPYSFFAAVALSQHGIYPVTAEAMEDCAAIAWSKTSLARFTSQYPVLSANAIQLFADSVKEFQERFRQMATERVERRLARTLLRLAGQTGKKTPEGVLIDLPLTRQDLAEMTGTTIFTVSRLLTAWENQGLIIADREHIVLRAPHSLVEIADQ